MNLILCPKKLRSTSGLTLIEVIVAMGVLVFLSFMIFQITMETYYLRDTLTQESEFSQSIRVATTLIQRDISMMYSPAMPSPLPTVPVVPEEFSRTFTFWSSTTHPQGMRPMHFIGTEQKISFVALSHFRIYKNSPETEFAKITYEVKQNEINKELNQGPMVLIKTENSNIFSNDDIQNSEISSIHSYPLLYGIQKMKFLFYQREPGGNIWKTFTTWDSDHEDTKNTYPQMIEVRLEVMQKKQVFEGHFKFKPEMPFYGLPSSL